MTSTGSLASAVKLYATNPTTTNGLSSNISVTITEGAAGADCTTFGTGTSLYTGKLVDLGTAKTNFSSGVGTWAPTGTATETRAYQITYTLDANTPNTAQGGTASVGFTWEAQNS